MDIQTPVYDWDDAVNFIAARCNHDKKTIDEILLIEEDYMRSIGIIVDGEAS